MIQKSTQIKLNTNQQNKVLQFPQKCTCEFRQQISAYRCQFFIKNISNQTVYVHLTSTLLNYMQVETYVAHITPGQAKKITAKLRPPNQIYPLQFIGIYYSFIQKISYLSILREDILSSIIKLQFVTDTNQDSQIDAILKQCSNNQLEEAELLIKKGDFRNAIYKAQQAFTLYRKNLNSLVLIAQVQLKLGNYLEASRKVQLLFYFPESPQYMKAVVIKAQTILFLFNGQQFPAKLITVKRLMHLLKQVTQSGLVDEEYEMRSNQTIKKLQIIKQQILQKQEDGLFHELLQKSILHFNQHQQIKSQFQNKQHYQQFLRKLLKVQLKNQNQTPQYALDPVNYEIFMDPVITPAGVSYEKNFMINFFKKHGPQDPLTRTYLDPNSVINNITLKILVRNNPNLSKWIKFQQQASKF